MRISIHALRAEGDQERGREEVRGGISIHALRAEGDAVMIDTLPAVEIHFYPRPPCGGRLDVWAHDQDGAQNFYPRPPCGGRPEHLPH